MNFLNGYDSGSDDEDKSVPSSPAPPPTNTSHFSEYKPMTQALCVAPPVPVSSAMSNTQLIKHDQKEIRNNPRLGVVLAPQSGPAHPFRFNAAANGAKQAGMGQIEETNIEAWTFDEQYHSFVRSGFAIDSETNDVLGNYQEYLNTGGDTARTVRGRVRRVCAVHTPDLICSIFTPHCISFFPTAHGHKLLSVSTFLSILCCSGPKKDKRKREESYADLGDESQGPWATERVEETAVTIPAVEEESETKNEKEDKEEEKEKEEDKEGDKEEKEEDNLVHIVEPDEEEEMWEKVNERKISRTLPPRPARGSTISEVGSGRQSRVGRVRVGCRLRLSLSVTVRVGVG